MLPYYASSPVAARKYLRKWRASLPATACVRGSVILAEPPPEHHVVLQPWYIKHGQWRFPYDERLELKLPDLDPTRLKRVLERAIEKWAAQGGFEQDEKRDWGVTLHLAGADLNDAKAALQAQEAPNLWWAQNLEG